MELIQAHQATHIHMGLRIINNLKIQIHFKNKFTQNISSQQCFAFNGRKLVI